MTAINDRGDGAVTDTVDQITLDNLAMSIDRADRREIDLQVHLAESDRIIFGEGADV